MSGSITMLMFRSLLKIGSKLALRSSNVHSFYCGNAHGHAIVLKRLPLVPTESVGLSASKRHFRTILLAQHQISPRHGPPNSPS